MEYKPDIIFDNDEQNLNEFYNTLYIDSLKFKKGNYSLYDLEQMLKKNEYPQIQGAKEILEWFIELKKVVLCSNLEHRGSAFN